MFTGLIEDIGTLVGIQRHGKSASLQVATELDTGGISLGDSIAVNGACLTVEGLAPRLIGFHCLAETLSRTNLGKLASGAPLNLERALAAGARMGGHIVTGHVDFCGKVLSAGTSGGDFKLTVAFPAEQRDFFVLKGSVAINGVSLTIAGLEENSFSVCLIPLTRAATNLDGIKPGYEVNVETDILGKYVVSTLTRRNGGSVTMEALQKAGFI